MKLEGGQVAVVTGAASGIGRGLAEAFAARGLSVVLADVESAALETAASELGATGGETLAVKVDVSDPEQVDELARRTLERFGRIDVVCNDAGVRSRGHEAMWEFDRADWEWVLGVNLWGVINGIRTFVPLLVEQGTGHVVNMSSLAGVATVPYLGAYTASKHAVVGISESLRAELDECCPGVGVTVVCPSLVTSRLADAERNRPSAFRADDVPAQPVDPARSVARRTAMEPSDVAGPTLAAIEENRLHLAPGRVSVSLVAARVGRLLTDLTG